VKIHIAVPESLRQIITSGDIAKTNAISQEEDENSIYNDPNFQASTSSREFDLLTQEELDDLVRDINMFKKQTEFLEFSLKGWNLLHRDKNRQDEFKNVKKRILYLPVDIRQGCIGTDHSPVCIA
jgi:hypothetical protein